MRKLYWKPCAAFLSAALLCSGCSTPASGADNTTENTTMETETVLFDTQTEAPVLEDDANAPYHLKEELVDLLENFSVLQSKEDGTYTSDYFLETNIDTVNWGRLPNKDSAPVLTVESGSTVTIDTLSHEGILEDQGRDPVSYFTEKGVAENMILEDAIEIASSNLEHSFDEDGPHVITGPIFVDGAEAGDVLKVEVLSLAPRVPYGIISNRHYKGTLTEEFPENEGRQEGAGAENPQAYQNVSIYAPIKEIDGEYYGYLDDGSGSEVSFKLSPFLGTMGVAANSSEKASTVPPTRLGGNLDINELGAGSTLYLPIDVDGALFYVGDPHFSQGDGEVALTALEGSLRATVRLTVIKNGSDGVPGENSSFDMAFGETEDFWIPIGLNEDLDEAMKMSVRESIDFISEEFGLDRALTYAYLSSGTDYEVSQVVDKTKGIHALVKKADFSDYVTWNLKAGEETFDVEVIKDHYYAEAEPVLAALGITMTGNGSDESLSFQDQTCSFSVGSNLYLSSEKMQLLECPPVLKDGRLYLPISVFSKVLKIPVNWSTTGGIVTASLGVTVQ